MSDIVERLNMIRGTQFTPIEDALVAEASDTITALRAELAEARETIIAFAGPWATQHARDYGLPDGHLHPTHYDILAKAGARMDDFARAALSSITGDE